jgi:signal transduction histidine kinase
VIHLSAETRSGGTDAVDTRWGRWGSILDAWAPYAGLGVATAIALVFPLRSGFDPLPMFALVGASAAWVYVGYTRASQPRRGTLRHATYFIGLIIFASLLMAQHPVFFLFGIAGFFHAADLRPWPLVFLGVFLTSASIQTITTGFPWPTAEAWAIFVPVIAIQTVAIGSGILIGEKLADLSEERRKAVARLEATLEENAGLHAQLLVQAREAGVLDERGRLAREIHDTLAQGLIGIITQLEAVQHATDPDERRRHLDNASRLARESLTEARRSVEAIRPEALESATLPAALAGVAGQWSSVNRVPAEVTTTGAATLLDPDVEVTLLRVAQEALANVAKHARATRVGLTLSYMGDVVTLDIRDDGVGFTNGSSGTDAGFGLTTMRERVERVAGTLEIESEPGGGTAVSARVPATPGVGAASE